MDGGLTATSSTMYFTGSGLAPTPRYTKEEPQGLIEYGITDNLTGDLHARIAAHRHCRADQR